MLRWIVVGDWYLYCWMSTIFHTTTLHSCLLVIKVVGDIYSLSVPAWEDSILYISNSIDDNHKCKIKWFSLFKWFHLSGTIGFPIHTGCIPLASSKITQIMVHQSNQIIPYDHRFTSSFGTLWSEWSWITDPDPDHPTWMQPVPCCANYMW